MPNPADLHCVSRIAVKGLEGTRTYVEAFVEQNDRDGTRPIYKMADEYCLADADGSFVVVRTGERLRRVL